MHVWLRGLAACIMHIRVRAANKWHKKDANTAAVVYIYIWGRMCGKQDLTAPIIPGKGTPIATVNSPKLRELFYESLKYLLAFSWDDMYATFAPRRAQSIIKGKAGHEKLRDCT